MNGMNDLRALRGQAAIVGAATYGCGECPGHTDMELLAHAQPTRPWPMPG
jgi:hypothetical protein